MYAYISYKIKKALSIKSLIRSYFKFSRRAKEQPESTGKGTKAPASFLCKVQLNTQISEKFTQYDPFRRTEGPF